MAVNTAAEGSSPAEWQGLVKLAASEITASGLRRLKRWMPSMPVFRADGLALPVPSILRGNPDLAGEIYRGRFRFAGTTIDAGGQSIFDHTTAPAAWLKELHGFTWLADLRASGRELSRAQARSLVSEWTIARKNHPKLAFATGVTGRRLTAWVRHADFLLHGASGNFHKGFMASATAEARALSRLLASETDHRARLTGAIALTYASLALSGLKAQWPLAVARLTAELQDQVLADGGHRSRSPQVLLDILLDLLPIRAMLEDARIEVPAELYAALERMVPMLRFFLHGDGGLAAFHGVSDPAAGKVRAALDLDRVEGRPLIHAVHSGYCRLAHGPCAVIMDVGRPPPPGSNDQAGASPLAFEFSDGGNRLVVNCGSPLGSAGEWRRAARLTDAHSTVCLGQANAATIVDNPLVERIFGTPALMGPRNVSANVQATADGTVVAARHDGYVAQFGIAVERRLYVAATGRDVRGEDRFFADLEGGANIEAVPFALRFHLHPAVRATVSQDGASVMLVLPDRNGWRFSARGGRLGLEDSVYLLGRGGPRRTQQIVVSGVVGHPDRVNW
ncbi:MAG: heparinase II/III family protein, partial [Hyphomicrobiales bacterium]